MNRVINSHGVGQYIAGFPCPYSQVVDPGALLPQLYAGSGLGSYLAADLALYPQMVQARGLGCGCGGECGCGMGALSMDGTGLFGSGLFASPFDLSTWGIGEYLALLLGAYVVYAVTSSTKAEFRRASKGFKKLTRRRRVAKAA
jgi:hypothetical protein